MCGYNKGGQVVLNLDCDIYPHHEGTRDLVIIVPLFGISMSW